MSEDPAKPDPEVSDLALQHLRDVRHALLRLHKTLLEAERMAFERAHGRVGTSGEFVQLVTGDPWFAWLHPLSELIVQIDERLDADDPPGERDARDLVDRSRSLLIPAEDGAAFARRYYDALQRVPDVVMAHAELAGLLANK